MPMKTKKSDYLPQIVVFSALAYYFVAGCSSSLDEGPQQVDLGGQLVETLAVEYTDRYMGEFSRHTKILHEQAESLCSTDAPEKSLEQIQSQWEKAMIAYHKLKVVMFAPESVLNEEENSSLRFIYRPLPPARAERFIRRQIRSAADQKQDYVMNRPLSHSTGLNALENLLFNILEKEPNFADNSGECVFLTYTTRKLNERAEELTLGWKNNEFARLKSAQGKAEVQSNLAAYTSHLVAYTDKNLKSLGIAAPLGQRPERHSCEENCATEYLEHPFYPDRKISLVAPLEVIHQLFVDSSGKSIDPKPAINYTTYLSETNPNLKSKSYLDGLTAALELSRLLPSGAAYFDAFDGSISGEKDAELILDNLTKFTNCLKFDFLLEMNTEIPQPVQGDND